MWTEVARVQAGKVLGEARAEDSTTRRRLRRFTMQDAMILVAGLGGSFAMTRSSLGRPVADFPGWILALTGLVSVVRVITPAALILHLRAPRRSTHQLARQPGFAALVASSTALLLELLAIAIIATIRMIKSGLTTSTGRPALTPDPMWWVNVTIYFDGVVGLAVIGAWLLLALSDRRRPEPHWLDYLGRSIGTAWVVLFVAQSCSRLSRTIE